MKGLLAGLILGVSLLTGCAVNPVTGKQELSLVSETKEIGMGTEYYGPSRQMQGGDATAFPEINAYVNSVGQRLAAVSDRKLPYEFTVINDSTPNAWALPGGKIAINRGLLTELKSEAELAAVLGHEIVHAAARHGAKGMERGMLLQGAVLAVGLSAGNSEYAGLAVGGAGLAAGMIGQKYGRDAERESDYYGMEYMSRAGYDPRAAIDLQETFVRLSEGQNSNWLSGLFSSHPPSQERVEANRKTAQSLPPGGEIGAERYLQKMAPLLAAEPAYAAYDEGRKALAKGDAPKALALAEKAIATEPREALFYGLRGDALQKRGNYREAVAEYDRALQRNGDYFHYYLQRGLAREKLGEPEKAYADLEASVKRLPTAPALNALGNLALARGEREKAKEFYAAAAGSDSPPGQEANKSLVRLDLPDHPEKYLQLGVGLDQKGYLAAQVTNATPLPVKDIVLTLSYTDGSGKRSVSLTVPGPLEPGKSAVVSSGAGPYADPGAIKGVNGTVTRARLAE